MATFVVPLLYEVFRQHHEERHVVEGDVSPSTRALHEWYCHRAVASLWVIATWETHFPLPSSSRAAL